MKMIGKMFSGFFAFFCVLILIAFVSRSYAQDRFRAVEVTDRTYSDKLDLNREIKGEFGENCSLGDWNDLKAIRNIDDWIRDMKIQDNWQIICNRDGNATYTSGRRYFAQFFANGRPPAGFIVHDKIGDRLFLGSWYNFDAHVLVIESHGKGYQELRTLEVSDRTYSDKLDFNNVIKREFGEGCAFGDWNDLKSIRNIDEWIRDNGIRDNWQIILTRDGNATYYSGRRYFAQYFANGNPPTGFTVHDKIGDRLFLGSWHDFDAHFLIIRSRSRNYRKFSEFNNYENFRQDNRRDNMQDNRRDNIQEDHPNNGEQIFITSKTFSEKVDLNKTVKKEGGKKSTIADWNDLKSIRNINVLIKRLKLKDGWTFMVTKDGNLYSQGNRQYFVYYSAKGTVPPGFEHNGVYDQIGDKLYLGAWYDLKAHLLYIKN